MANEIVEYKGSLMVPIKDSALAKQVLLAKSDDIIRDVPPHWNTSAAQIVSTVTMVIATGSKELLQGTLFSLLQAVKLACECGLSFSKNFGQAYLVPFGKEVTLIIGYQGWLEMLRRFMPDIVMTVQLVYQGEPFHSFMGSSPRIEHEMKPSLRGNDDNIVAAYSVATYPNGGQSMEIMSIDEIKAIRAKARGCNSPAWRNYFGQMARKTVIRRHVKYLPVATDPVIEKAMTHDNQTTGIDFDKVDRPELSLDDHLDGFKKTPGPIIDADPIDGAAAASAALAENEVDDEETE